MTSAARAGLAAGASRLLTLYKFKGNPHIRASAQGAREPLMWRFTSSSNLL